MFPFRHELHWKTLYKVQGHLVRKLGLLHNKIGATLYAVQRYFVSSFGQLCMKFGATSYEMCTYI